MKRTTKRTPAVLSVFTGAGGLDLGLEAAGFRIAGCIEINGAARATLRANRTDWPILQPCDANESAKQLRPEVLAMEEGELGVLAGGPPCQPFSKAAQWSQRGLAGLGDERSSCIGAFLDLLHVFLPKVVLIENVPGFANGRTNALPIIEERLRRTNRRQGTRYQLHRKVLDAADYGVPQRRKRVILVARRDGRGFEWPRPTHRGRAVRSWDAIGSLQESNPPKATGRWAGLLPSIPEGRNYLWHTERGGGRPLFGYRTRFWCFLLKLARDQPAWTIPARPGPGTGPFHWDNRPLSPREAARLQTFPLSWRVLGSERAQLRQLGNATPPLLAEVIGRSIGEQWFDLQYEGPPEFRIPRKNRIPRPAEPTAVPESFLGLEGDHPAHPGPGMGPRPRQRRQQHGGTT